MTMQNEERPSPVASRTDARERPILFSGPMVRAILAGTKTQTRRLVNWPVLGPPAGGKRRLFTPQRIDVERADLLRACPYGQPGERLWVRETWAHYQTVDHRVRADGAAFSEVSDGLAAYRADGFDAIEELRSHIRLTSGPGLEAVEIRGDCWRPSIHMPRWASRLSLEVTDVRVERLQDISEEDARAEGALAAIHARDGQAHVNDMDRWARYTRRTDPGSNVGTARGAFAALWDSLAPEGSRWADNPFDWAISFQKAVSP